MKVNARSSRRARPVRPDGWRARKREVAADAFVEAAEAVFAARGYDRATMQDICWRCLENSTGDAIVFVVMGRKISRSRLAEYRES